MSDCDQIIINDSTTNDYIVITDNVIKDNVDVVAEGSLVTSVNSRIGAIFLTKSDVKLDLVDNTSDLNKPISNATLSALLFKVDLSAFNTLNDIVTSQYGSWNNVYFTVNSLSGNWNLAYSNTSKLSSDFNSLYSTVNLNSSTNWNYLGTDIKALTGNWNSTYSWVNTNSSIATFTISISAPSLSGTFYGDGSKLTGVSNYNGTDIKSLTGNWQNTFNTVSSLSSNWQSAYIISTYYQNTSGIFLTNTNFLTAYTNNTILSSLTSTLLPTSIYQNTSGSFATNTLLQSTSALLTPLTTTSNLTSQLVTNTNFVNYQTNVAISTATLLPTSIYQNSSGFFAINTLLQSTSALLTPLTLTNDLTSLLVKTTDFTSYQTNVAISTATLLPTSIYQNTSGLFVKNTTINSVSGNWDLAYTNISKLSTTYSAVTAINGTIYQIQSINNNGTVILSIPNSFRTPGDLNVGGNLYVAGSGIVLNTSTLSVSSPILYINNSLSGENGNVFDIGFVGHFNNGLYQHTGLVRSAQNNYWSLFSGLTSEPLDAHTLNYSNPTFTIDTLRANILGNLSGDNISTKVASFANGAATIDSSGNLIANSASFTNLYNPFDQSLNRNDSVNFNQVDIQQGVNAQSFQASETIYAGSGDIHGMDGGDANGYATFGRTDNQTYAVKFNASEGSSFSNGVVKIDKNGNITTSASAVFQSISALNIYVGNGNSNNWNTAYTNLISNSSAYLSAVNLTLINSTSGNWNAVYNTVSSLSAGWVGGNSAYTWVNLNSSIATFTISISAPSLSGTFYGDGSKLTGVSNYQGTDIKSLTGNWQNTFNTVSSLSSTWASGGNSNYPLLSSGFLNSQTIVNITSSNWNSLYATVNSLSSSWGSGLSAIGANIVSNYGVLSSYIFNGDGSSSIFDLRTPIPYAVAAGYLVSMNGSVQIPYIDYNIVYSGTNKLSTSFIPRNGSTISVIGISINNQYTSIVQSNSANWNNAYNTAVAYQNASAAYITSTLLNATSSLLTPLTLVNTLTSQLLLNSNFTNYQTSVASSTATLLPTSVFQNASGSFLTSIPTSLSANWQSTYSTVTALSANWQNASDSLDFILINSNFNVIVNRQYLIDTTTTTVSGNLPTSPSIGDNILFVDAYNTWGSKPLILGNNGNLLQTYNEALTANISGYQFKLVYIGGSYGWKIV